MNWNTYLKIHRAEAVPYNAFCTRNPIEFKIGMVLEIVDQHVPQLIRPATVQCVSNYKIKVLFNGWPTTYEFWTDDDSPDIHPVSWCLKTDHPLETPLGNIIKKKKKIIKNIIQFQLFTLHIFFL